MRITDTLSAKIQTILSDHFSEDVSSVDHNADVTKEILAAVRELVAEAKPKEGLTGISAAVTAQEGFDMGIILYHARLLDRLE